MATAWARAAGGQGPWALASGGRRPFGGCAALSARAAATPGARGAHRRQRAPPTAPTARRARSIIANGEKLPDQEQCLKEQTYMNCFNARTKQWTTYAGLAAGSGGLLVLCGLLFRYG